LLVFSLVDPPLSLFQLDKLLAVIEREHIPAAIGLTKLDLPGAEEVLAQVETIYGSLGYPIVALSLRTGTGKEELHALLEGRVTVLAGLSGVGKSTLLKELSPASTVVTGAVGERSHRGRHTTTHVELFPYDGGFIADTPGFSQIDLTDLELSELALTFRELAEAAHDCEFRGCLHMGEQGCAVRILVDSNQIAISRYEHYLQLLAELKEAKARRY